MIELNSPQNMSIKHFLPDIQCDSVYAYSIIESRQRGRVFVDDVNNPQTVLLWHYNSFAFVSGRTDNNEFNHSLKKLLSGDYEENQRRFVLLVNDKKWNDLAQSLIVGQSNTQIKERLRFRFDKKAFCDINICVPGGYTLRKLDKEIIGKLQGWIIPAYSWHSSEAFLAGGIGYCLMDGENIACNSFSSAIGNRILDIGVETMVEYRMRGLAVSTAGTMVKYSLNNGFLPNWGCNSDNTGSVKVAEHLGFKILDSHPMYIYQP